MPHHTISVLTTVCGTPCLRTAWSRVLLEKLTGFQLVKIFPTFYGTRRFITVFTSQLSLSCASSIQFILPHPTSWRSILYVCDPVPFKTKWMQSFIQCSQIHKTPLFVSRFPGFAHLSSWYKQHVGEGEYGTLVERYRRCEYKGRMRPLIVQTIWS